MCGSASSSLRPPGRRAPNVPPLGSRRRAPNVPLRRPDHGWEAAAARRSGRRAPTVQPLLRKRGLIEEEPEAA